VRIALVVGKYHAAGGGAERWTDRHARYLLSQGFDVDLIARSFHGPPEQARCHEVVTRAGWGRRLQWASAVERKLQQEKFDVVHDMGDTWSGDLFMPHHGSRQAGLDQNLQLIPPALRPLQAIFHQTLPRYREFAELERRQYSAPRSTRFVAISQKVARDMQDRHGVPAERIDLVYNGIDTSRFTPGDGSALRQQWGWDDRTIFLLVAHNFRLKGLGESIRALATLAKNGEKVAFVVAGNGRESAYRPLLNRLGCSERVRFLGNVQDVVTVFRAADVYVQPTHYDPCSLVVLEALACGKPAITTSVNGASELMTSAMGEVISSPGDHLALVQAMNRFLDPRERALAGQAARDAMGRHTLARNSDEIISLYHRSRRDGLAWPSSPAA
jgi:UDP-glucose:(heptosyl)LPS alpha-1,3-glucosyltransferase